MYTCKIPPLSFQKNLKKIMKFTQLLMVLILLKTPWNILKKQESFTQQLLFGSQAI